MNILERELARVRELAVPKPPTVTELTRRSRRRRRHRAARVGAAVVGLACSGVVALTWLDSEPDSVTTTPASDGSATTLGAVDDPPAETGAVDPPRVEEQLQRFARSLNPADLDQILIAPEVSFGRGDEIVVVRERGELADPTSWIFPLEGFAGRSGVYDVRRVFENLPEHRVTDGADTPCDTGRQRPAAMDGLRWFRMQAPDGTACDQFWILDVYLTDDGAIAGFIIDWPWPPSVLGRGDPLGAAFLAEGHATLDSATGLAAFTVGREGDLLCVELTDGRPLVEGTPGGEACQEPAAMSAWSTLAARFPDGTGVIAGLVPIGIDRLEIGLLDGDTVSVEVTPVAQANAGAFVAEIPGARTIVSVVGTSRTGTATLRLEPDSEGLPISF